jgi:hypothetical protein
MQRSNFLRANHWSAGDDQILRPCDIELSAHGTLIFHKRVICPQALLQ